MIRDYATYMAYWKSLADIHPSINFFVPGPLDRVIGQERRIASWPILHASDPGIFGDSEGTSYKGAWAILKHVEIDDWKKQDLAMNQTYHIASHIMAKMHEDMNEGLFEIEKSFDLDPVTGITHANDYGWRFDFQIRTPIGVCLPACSGLDTPIVLPYFSYEISDNVLNITLAQSNWQEIVFTNWETGALISGIVPLSPGTEVSQNISSFPDVFLATVELDSGHKASAIIAKSVPCGFSVPYVIS